MLKLMLTDRELRELARLIDGHDADDQESRNSLADKVEAIIEQNIGGLLRIAAAERVR